MPRPAYIFLKSVLKLSCLMLAAALLLFCSADSGSMADYEKLKYARLFLENPAGILLTGAIGFAILLDMR